MVEAQRIIDLGGATVARPRRSRGFTLETDVDVTELEGWRRSLSRGDAPHPTVEDAVIAAAARVLIGRGEIGELAVAGEEGRALPVPAGAELLDPREIAARGHAHAGAPTLPTPTAVIVVGPVRHELVRWEDEIVDRLRVAISLGVERRVPSVDAAHFLRDLRELLEHPVAGLDLE
jgi:hypothetical protein